MMVDLARKPVGSVLSGDRIAVQVLDGLPASRRMCGSWARWIGRWFCSPTTEESPCLRIESQQTNCLPLMNIITVYETV